MNYREEIINFTDNYGEEKEYCLIFPKDYQIDWEIGYHEAFLELLKVEKKYGSRYSDKKMNEDFETNLLNLKDLKIESPKWWHLSGYCVGTYCFMNGYNLGYRMELV